MSIYKRRERIKQIIEETEVNTQGELARILSLEGYSVTQATVSRDIKELGLIKEKGKVLNYRYALPDGLKKVSEDKVIHLLKTFVISVSVAKNLIVVKTLEGHGSACGMAIDKLSLKGVLGSIAGDDTLLIVAESDESAKFAEQTIKGTLKV
ncbi:MAG: arginine repressor [Clostridia bacterium]|jgi:transcriptional regulator of arginine metabolism|nr:arginine repressor [Clostridia bacterium]